MDAIREARQLVVEQLGLLAQGYFREAHRSRERADEAEQSGDTEVAGEARSRARVATIAGQLLESLARVSESVACSEVARA
jgi:hypothetical protein